MGIFLKTIWYLVLIFGVLYYSMAMFKGGTVTRRFCSIVDKEFCYNIAEHQDNIHSRILEIVKKGKGTKEPKVDE